MNLRSAAMFGTMAGSIAPALCPLLWSCRSLRRQPSAPWLPGVWGGWLAQTHDGRNSILQAAGPICILSPMKVANEMAAVMLCSCIRVKEDLACVQ